MVSRSDTHLRLDLHTLHLNKNAATPLTSKTVAARFVGQFLGKPDTFANKNYLSFSDHDTMNGSVNTALPVT
jgi:hypothetical protein